MGDTEAKKPTGKGIRYGGRAKGTPNKRTWEAREVAERLGFCPIEALIHWARGDWKALGYDKGTKTVVLEDGGTLEVDRIDENLRQKSTKDVVGYLYPQLKSVELGGDAGDAIAQSLTALIAGAQGSESGNHSKPGTDSSSEG